MQWELPQEEGGDLFCVLASLYFYGYARVWGTLKGLQCLAIFVCVWCWGSTLDHIHARPPQPLVCNLYESTGGGYPRSLYDIELLLSQCWRLWHDWDLCPCEVMLRQGTCPYVGQDSASLEVISEGQRIIWGDWISVTDRYMTFCNRHMFQ